MTSITKFFGSFNFKKALMLLASPFVALYNDYKVMAIGLLILILIDLITGIKVYVKDNNLKLSLFKPSTWGIINSAGLRQTIAKFKDYVVVIVAVFFFDNYILKSPLIAFGYNLTEILILVLAVVELWSIGENFKSLRGYNIFDYIRKLIFKKDLEGVMGEISGNKSN